LTTHDEGEFVNLGHEFGKSTLSGIALLKGSQVESCLNGTINVAVQRPTHLFGDPLAALGCSGKVVRVEDGPLLEQIEWQLTSLRLIGDKHQRLPKGMPNPHLVVDVQIASGEVRNSHLRASAVFEYLQRDVAALFDLVRVHWRGQTFSGKHASLVDETIFKRVQKLLKERGQDCAQRVGQRSDFLLSGLLRCGRCRRAYVGMSARGNGGLNHYYACSGRQKRGPKA
jgi:hypothetical protein